MSDCRDFVKVEYWGQQSPIRIVKGASYYVPDLQSRLEIRYDDKPVRVEVEGEHGHANLVLKKGTPDRRPLVRYDGLECRLAKIHLHRRSEHEIDGKEYAAEVHLVHEIVGAKCGSTLLVLGVMFEVDESADEHPFLEAAGRLLAAGCSEDRKDPDRINPYSLLPKVETAGGEKELALSFYRYEGSLTSVPYSEDVSWIVFSTPMHSTSRSFKKLDEFAEQPERSPQALSRRFVLRSFE